MLLGTLAASTLANSLSGRGVLRAGQGLIRTGNVFRWHPILSLMLNYKNIKTNLNLAVFVQEIVYLK